MTERRLLQLAVFILAWVPVTGGAAGVILGASLMGTDVGVDASLDSHVRYLSGLLFAIGIGFWSTIARIETKGRRFRLLTVIVFTGGLARLAGVVLVGVPSSLMLFGLVMELVVTPLLCLWQARVATDRSLRTSRS
jgi:hypothetical protein